MNEVFRKETEGIELLARGEVIDDDPGFHGSIYSIRTATFRMNGKLMNEFIMTDVMNDRQCYEDEKEWKKYEEGKEIKREKFRKKISGILGFGEEDIVLKQAISEIFIAVKITKIKEGGKEDEQ